ncbi:MAG: GNAT family N-acetyltransferase [Alphaproteobacteria bacterium]|nr:GNAT family N-acetyltransferase [Alphaproteobacteria bacterium]
MTDYRIRPSTPADTEILGKIHAQAWRETYGDIVPADILATAASVEHRTEIRKKIFAHSKPDCGHFLIDSDAGEIVGFGDCGPARDVKIYAPGEIYTLYLLRAAQGRALGGRLLRHMLGYLAAQGFDGAALEVFAKNDSTIGFYKHLGGREIARKDTEMGGVSLPVAVFVWDDLQSFKQEKS